MLGPTGETTDWSHFFAPQWAVAVAVAAAAGATHTRVPTAQTTGVTTRVAEAAVRAR